MTFLSSAGRRQLRCGVMGLSLVSVCALAHSPLPILGVSAITCTLGVESSAPAAETPVHPGSDAACLITPSDLDGIETIYDVRSRPEFIASHIPGAIHTSPGILMTMPGVRTKTLAVYEAGKFPSDALMLCERLHKAGMTNAKVLEGGFAAWSQSTNHPSRLTAARLSDAEVAAAIGGPTTRVIAVSPALKDLANGIRYPAQEPHRIVLLVEPDLPVDGLRRHIDRAPLTAFYWRGVPSRLASLMRQHAAQNRKRIAGPSESPVCDSL